MCIYAQSNKAVHLYRNDLTFDTLWHLLLSKNFWLGLILLKYFDIGELFLPLLLAHVSYRWCCWAAVANLSAQLVSPDRLWKWTSWGETSAVLLWALLSCPLTLSYTHHLIRSRLTATWWQKNKPQDWLPVYRRYYREQEHLVFVFSTVNIEKKENAWGEIKIKCKYNAKGELPLGPFFPGTKLQLQSQQEQPNANHSVQ